MSKAKPYFGATLPVQPALQLALSLSVLLTILSVAMLNVGRSLPRSEIAFISERTGNADIFIMDADRRVVYNLTRSPAWERGLVWSPEGERLAFYSNRTAQWEVYTVDVTGRNLRQVTENRLFETGLVWFTGSDSLAFVVPGAAERTLVTYDIQGGTTDQRAYSDIFSPVWSPDGKQIAYFSFTSRRIGLFVLDTTDESRRMITDDIRPQARDIAWSADQQHIAFVSHGEIFISDLTPGTARRLVNMGAGGAWEPSWSRDGTQIAFMSFRDGNAELYVINADGSHLRRLTEHPANDGLPVWRP